MLEIYYVLKKDSDPVSNKNPLIFWYGSDVARTLEKILNSMTEDYEPFVFTEENCDETVAYLKSKMAELEETNNDLIKRRNELFECLSKSNNESYGLIYQDINDLGSELEENVEFINSLKFVVHDLVCLKDMVISNKKLNYSIVCEISN